MILVSSRVCRLFEVELRNAYNDEELGEPTLGSVIDTIQQAPDDVLEDWCRDYVDGIEDEVCALAERYGESTYLWDQEIGEPAFRESAPLERLAEVAE